VSVCLDSWAVIAWLDGDKPAAGIVQAALESERPWMSWLNLGEVAYLVERRRGRGVSAEVIGKLRHAVRLDEVTPERVLAAAQLKAVHPIALADCFAVATATAHEATLFTGDPEILGRDLGCRMRDLRSKAERA
jgi:predicted nucleic acid-binding protein